MHRRRVAAHLHNRTRDDHEPVADNEGPRRRKPQRRRDRPRKHTIAIKTLTRERLLAGWDEIGGKPRPELMDDRPRTRADCEDRSERPCPWVGCKYHLYLDVDPETGSIVVNFPDLEPWELTHTCTLDVAAQGGLTLVEVGDIMNLTRERIRQIEIRATVYKMKPEMKEHEPEGKPTRPRSLPSERDRVPVLDDLEDLGGDGDDDVDE